MPYASVDRLQNMLAQEVFGYAKDKKKASGRALGTLVEIVTFYTLCSWELRDSIAIERGVPEFAHPEIAHNVDFASPDTLHPCRRNQTAPPANNLCESLARCGGRRRRLGRPRRIISHYSASNAERSG